MSQIQTSTYVSPVGELILGEFEGKLCLCDWKYRLKRKEIDMRIQKGLQATFIEQENALLLEVKKQLTDYFHNKRTLFDIPFLLVGTEFQQKVWMELQKIPYGSTSSYLELAQQLGDKKAIRAVAAANGANAISILIPCHRIIGSKQELIGYAGGVHAKKNLLQLENPDFQKDTAQLSMDF